MASGIPAGVIDVGSNTVRLLVARFDDAGPVTICSGRVRLGLGAELEQLGRVSARKLAEATDAVRSLGALAARHGLEAPEVLVTAPGRQAANASELVAALERGTRGAGARAVGDGGGDAVVLRRGRRARQTAWPVAVVDLGGASTEIAVGRPSSGPGWIRSVDLGALRLMTRLLPAEQPAAGQIDAARVAVAEAFALDRAAARVRGARRRRLRARAAQDWSARHSGSSELGSRSRAARDGDARGDRAGLWSRPAPRAAAARGGADPDGGSGARGRAAPGRGRRPARGCAARLAGRDRGESSP